MSTLRQRAGQAAIAARLRVELRRRAAYDRLSEDGQAAWRTARLDALRRHAIERSPGYRALHHGLEGAPLHELPTVTKDDVVDGFDRFVTDRLLDLESMRRRIAGDDPGASQGYRISATSGSSGRPGLFPFDGDEWLTLLVASARARSIPAAPRPPTGHAGPTRTRVARITTPSPWSLSAQLHATITDPRRPTLALSVASGTAALRDRLAEWQPDVLTSYPSVLDALAAEQLAGRLDIRPARVFSGGEHLDPAVRERIERAWGTVAIDQYLTAEVGFLAIECDHHAGMHVIDDHVVLEVVDRHGSPVGPSTQGARVLVTVLGSRTLPLIRYELGDAATLAGGPCPCGRRSPRIRSVAGSARPLIELPAAGGGLIDVHPVAFTSVLDHVPVRAAQVVCRPDRFIVLVVDPEPTFDPSHLVDELGDALVAAGVRRLPVEVSVVDEVRRAPSGKAGLVISER